MFATSIIVATKINSNMRCIEIIWTKPVNVLEMAINSNMRCIEIAVV